jgi:hypothetical protein
MNNKVKKALVDDPVRIAVYDVSGSRVDVPSEENKGESIVWIDPSDESNLTSFVIRMDPVTIEGMSDIQYVVETLPFGGTYSPGSMSPSPGSPSNNRSPSPSAKIPVVTSQSPFSFFDGTSTGGGILCNGKRAHARGKAGYVKYSHEFATNKNQEIFAGWSEYHGPVTLTPRISFKIKNNNPVSDTASQHQGEL